MTTATGRVVIDNSTTTRVRALRINVMVSLAMLVLEYVLRIRTELYATRPHPTKGGRPLSDSVRP